MSEDVQVVKAEPDYFERQLQLWSAELIALGRVVFAAMSREEQAVWSTEHERLVRNRQYSHSCEMLAVGQERLSFVELRLALAIGTISDIIKGHPEQAGADAMALMEAGLIVSMTQKVFYLTAIVPILVEKLAVDSRTAAQFYSTLFTVLKHRTGILPTAYSVQVLDNGLLIGVVKQEPTA